MQRVIVGVASGVIRKADRRRPADAVLRAELREDRRLTSGQRSEIARAVFDYYRWFGWLDSRDGLREQLLHAASLGQSFAAESGKFPDKEIVNRAVPRWLGGFMKVTPGFARALQEQPRLWLRARKGQGTELTRRLASARLSDVVADAVEYLGAEDLFRHAEFKAGRFEIQDIGSQWVGHIASPAPGETWWNACAGEGGKMLHLSDLMENKGLVWASDRTEWRLRNLKQRAARARVFNYRAVVWDGSGKLPTRTKFDGILVDAPCSGVGTWRRNPHARWTTTQSDVRELKGVQRSLLENVQPALKSGGKLVYAVCTLTRVETSEVVEEFSAAHREFAPVSQAFLRPEETGGNGMFVAVWRRQ